jgi:hypothetical protein
MTRPALTALLALTAWSQLGACTVAVSTPPGPSPGVTASPSPSPAPSSPVTAESVSGSWVFGDANEPPAGPVVACNPFRLWNLTQDGTNVKGSVLACIGPCAAFTEEVTGTNVDGLLQLSGEAAESPSAQHVPVRYTLRFDAASQHLVGTRNGQPFWAAPFIQQATGCGPRPL